MPALAMDMSFLHFLYFSLIPPTMDRLGRHLSLPAACHPPACLYAGSRQHATLLPTHGTGATHYSAALPLWLQRTFLPLAAVPAIPSLSCRRYTKTPPWAGSGQWNVAFAWHSFSSRRRAFYGLLYSVHGLSIFLCLPFCQHAPTSYAGAACNAHMPHSAAFTPTTPPPHTWTRTPHACTRDMREAPAAPSPPPACDSPHIQPHSHGGDHGDRSQDSGAAPATYPTPTFTSWRLFSDRDIFPPCLHACRGGCCA